jgi:PKD repeat protein
MNRSTNPLRVGLVIAGILVVACTESVGPGGGGGGKTTGVPSFSFSASGITLHTDNGALGYSGRLVRKGFDRRDANNQIIHPNPGDAIVATFYWINPSGSTGNIIDSVRDVYTDVSFTPIGNTYHLVDFITAGGISMATYAATAVHFDTTRGYVFAVEADFRDSIPDGGVKMTAWTGVEDVFANAVGSFHSASVFASTPTPVAPGPITIGPGSAAYGVSLSNGAVNIASRPAGWTNIGGGIGSDGRLQDDGDYYLSPGGETINPQWTWDFQHASTALATVLELKPGTNAANQPPTANFTSSCSALACSFTSTSSDPDGSITAYSWNFGDGATSTVQNPSHTYASGGTYTVTLTVTDNQGAQSAPTSRTVTVTAANQSPTANFTSSCSGLSCNFTSTSSDPDGSIASYAWTFGDGTTSTAQNPSHTYAAGGTYAVTLTVTDNQGAQSAPTSKTVTVTAANQSPTANFTSSCSGLSCNFTSTSSDPDGSISAYSWTFGDGATSTAQSPSHSYAAGGTYTVTLRVTDNQGAQSTTTSKSVTVTAPNQPPTASFTSSCSGLSCNFTSTSSDPDGSISAYSWTFGDGATSTAQNPSHSYAAGGTYTVTLRVTDNQGAQSTTTSKSVTVTAPNSPPVVNAGPDQTALTGLLYSSTQSFSDANGNGPWSYRIDWGDGSVSTGTRTGTGSFTVGHTYVIILPRTFTVRVTVTDAAGASGSDTKNVSVLLL